MDPIRFVETHGVVLEGGRGPRPNLAEAVAGERIRGNWWAHKQRQAIFNATRAVRDCDEILVCRLIDGKVTYVHRRLWPVIVRLSKLLNKDSLAAIHEKHTPSGAHKMSTIPFPRWVPPNIRRAAEKLSEEHALSQVGEWFNTCVRKSTRRGG